MFDFPNNPTDGERVIHPNGRTYEFVTVRNSWAVVQEDLAILTTRINALEQHSFLILE
jgi:ribosomal protein S15P/S13E